MLKENLTRHTLWILLALGVVMEALFYGLSQVTDPVAQMARLFIFFTCAFGVYLAVVVYLHFFWAKTFFPPEVILIFAVVFRLTFLFHEPILSDDVYRYVWDGKVASHGINPYRYVPESDHLKGIRDETVYPHVNNKSNPTLNAPLQQIIFRIAAFVSPSLWTMKIILFLFEIGVLILLFLILRFLDRSLGWIVVYAWNPLVIVEFSGSGRGEVIGVFFMLFSLYLAIRARSIWAGAVLGFSILSNFAAFLALPFYEDLRSRWKTIALMSAATLLVVLVGYINYMDAGPYIHKGIKEYLATGEYNSSLYALTYHYAQSFFNIPASGETFLGIETNNQARTAANLLMSCAGLLIFLALFINHVRKTYEAQKENILKSVFIVMAAFTLLSPVLHPWHLIVLIPFLCIFPNPAWILFTGLVFLSYAVLPDRAPGLWKENTEILLWEYLPFYAILLGRLAWVAVKKFRSHPPEKLK